MAKKEDFDKRKKFFKSTLVDLLNGSERLRLKNKFNEENNSTVYFK